MADLIYDWKEGPSSVQVLYCTATALNRYRLNVHFNILYCNLIYCTVLYCTVPHFTGIDCTVLPVQV